MNQIGGLGRMRAAIENLRSGKVKRAKPSEVVICSINNRFFFLSLSAYFLKDIRPYMSISGERPPNMALSTILLLVIVMSKDFKFDSNADHQSLKL